MTCRRSGTYLEKLDTAIAFDCQHLPVRFKAAHARYLLNAQRTEGGFAGREGSCDLYYTSFGLLAADLLELDNAHFCGKSASFLRRRWQEARNVVDLFCVLRSLDLIERRGCVVWDGPQRERNMAAMGEILESCRTSEGGFGKAPSSAQSVYHTFIAHLCCEQLRGRWRLKRKAVAFVQSRQCDDGGFVDVAGGKGVPAGGANPTAAAIAFLKSSCALDRDTAERAAKYLASLQDPSGGVLAHADAPCPDVMSTFTCLVALNDLQAEGGIKLASAARFLQEQAMPDGGFRGTPFDGDADPEYTYYGLGALALLAAHLQTADPTGCSCVRRNA